MANQPPAPPKPAPSQPTAPHAASTGSGGELHQTSPQTLTTDQGVPVSDNQNSLRIGARGPTLLEDFALREKITHFDHERIPERIVHARGSAAHGYFQVYEPMAKLTRAAFLQNPAEQTRVFARFSTVAGGAGSADTVRDVRGFAVKFYTSEGNFDLVGNNIPVFFIQDAMKFPDLVHSVKMEPDRGFPQAASAHDTFWDFVSLMPESIHMVFWAMSDRAIPRSYRTMDGFGVHTFRMIDAEGNSRFVKFHWRPLQGMASLVWDEAVKLQGADCDFHRRDLWEAIEAGDFPEYELGVQVFDEAEAAALDFDALDPTKLIPEERIPITPLGKMVLNRNPDNFFAETEQSAFHPGNLVPGIDFSDDPLLQGRVFSYLDTQLIRLGGPNFHEIPINRPVCPIHNFQRDGHKRHHVPRGRVAYEPNSLDPDGPRASPDRGFRSFPATEGGERVRARSPSFSDQYSQAKLFYTSLSAHEREHIASAFAFELGKVETPAIRRRVLGHLMVVDGTLAREVAEQLGEVEANVAAAVPAVAPRDLPPSPALRIAGRDQGTLKGRKVGVLVSDGSSSALLDALRTALGAEGARLALVGPRVAGVHGSDGGPLAIDHALASGPSVFFDAVVLALTDAAAAEMAKRPAALDWVRDAFRHLKVIGHIAPSAPLLTAAGVADGADRGVLSLNDMAKDVRSFVDAAKGGRVWEREATLKP